MTLTKKNTKLKNNHKYLRDFKVPIILYLLVITAVTFLYTLNRVDGFKRTFGIDLCLADIYILHTDLEILFMIICVASAFLFTYLYTDKFRVQYIIRQKSRVSIWNKHILETFIISLIMTVYVSLCLYIFGRILTTGKLIDFNEYTSLFYKIVHRTTDKISVYAVISLCIATIFFAIFVTNLIILFARWCNRQVAGWILVVIIGCFETVKMDLEIFYNHMRILHEFWVDLNKIEYKTIYPVVLALFLYAAGCLLFKRKEYANVR